MCALCGILSVKDRWTEPLKREGVYVRASRSTLRRPAGDHRPQRETVGGIHLIRDGRPGGFSVRVTLYGKAKKRIADRAINYVQREKRRHFHLIDRSRRLAAR